MNNVQNQAKRLASPELLAKLRAMLQVENIPSRLQEIPQWVCWRGEYRNNNPKLSKVPVDPKTGMNASSTKPETWGAFNQALAHFEKSPLLCGLGFVLTPPFVGVDLDNCIDPETGIMQSWAKEILDDLNTYCEISPSGKGVKAFCLGDIPEAGSKRGDLEIYKSGRYFTVTGNMLDGYPDEPQEVSADILLSLWSRVRPPKAEQKPKAQESGGMADDDEVIRRAREASNGSKFSTLFSGDAGAYPSHSDADAALVGLLAFWTQDEVQIDRIFRRSGLYRDKWDAKNGEGTYGSRTIAAILAKGGDRWEPGGNGNGKPQKEKANGVEYGRDVNTPSEPPRPLQRELPPAEPYPVEALGDFYGAVAQKLHEAVGAPLALCAQCVIAALNLAVQPHANVVIDGRVIPLSLFLLTQGGTGERKSSIDAIALNPHRAYERELKPEHDRLFKEYSIKEAAFKKAREEALKKAKGYEAKRMALEELGDPPIPPLIPVLICEEPTYEGIIKLLAINRPSIGIFSGEGGTFIGGHAMSEENRLKSAAGLCAFWDGTQQTRIRAGDGVTQIVGRRVAIHLMAQPRVAAQMTSDPLLIDQGLMSRFLTVYPESTAGKRSYVCCDLSTDPLFIEYNRRILSILKTKLPTSESDPAILEPRSLPLSHDAKKTWVEFYNLVEGQLAEGGNLRPIIGFANKAAEHAARLAGNLTLADDLQAKEIPHEKMSAGIELAEHYLSEALRLFYVGATDERLTEAEKLLQWVKQFEYVHLRQIYRLGPNSIRDAAKAKSLVAILEDHGWLLPVEKGMVLDGAHRKQAWRVAR